MKDSFHHFAFLRLEFKYLIVNLFLCVSKQVARPTRALIYKGQTIRMRGVPTAMERMERGRPKRQ